jgi:hypothetical protein
MLKQSLSFALAALLFFVANLCPVAAQGGAAAQDQAEKVKTQVIRLGVGEKAGATVTMKDGTRLKGYVSQAGEKDFVIRDRKTDTPTNVFYSDVAKFKGDRGHPKTKTALIAAGVSVAAVLTVLGIIFASER